MMLTLLFALNMLPVAAVDTPPPPTREQLATLKSTEDVVDVSRSADGSRLPRGVVMPFPANHSQINDYLRENYPAALRNETGQYSRAWLWMYIDEKGFVDAPKIIVSSGKTSIDSLIVGIARMSRFQPATSNGKRLGIWTPYPADIPAFVDLKRFYPDSPRPMDEPPPGGPTFTPYTTKPQILNREQIGRALAQNYPPNLRSVGIGGETVIWLLLNQQGFVERTQIRTSSGHPELDDAALKVARMMRFSPAKNKGKPVKVWIQLPIVFKTQ